MVTRKRKSKDAPRYPRKRPASPSSHKTSKRRDTRTGTRNASTAMTKKTTSQVEIWVTLHRNRFIISSLRRPAGRALTHIMPLMGMECRPRPLRSAMFRPSLRKWSVETRAGLAADRASLVAPCCWRAVTQPTTTLVSTSIQLGSSRGLGLTSTRSPRRHEGPRLPCGTFLLPSAARTIQLFDCALLVLSRTHNQIERTITIARGVGSMYR